MAIKRELLRHANVGMTLDAYARATTPAKLEAQGWLFQTSHTSVKGRFPAGPGQLVPVAG